jgi:hypothetical protein
MNQINIIVEAFKRLSVKTARTADLAAACFEFSPSPPSPMEEKAGMRRRLFSNSYPLPMNLEIGNGPLTPSLSPSGGEGAVSAGEWAVQGFNARMFRGILTPSLSPLGREEGVGSICTAASDLVNLKISKCINT